MPVRHGIKPPITGDGMAHSRIARGIVILVVLIILFDFISCKITQGIEIH
jgi:hypothetical protein